MTSAARRGLPADKTPLLGDLFAGCTDATATATASGRCLAHADGAEQTAYLASLSPGADSPAIGRPAIGEALFDSATFNRDAWFDSAVFEGTSDLGPLVYPGTVELSGASFMVTVEVAADTAVFRRTRWAQPVTVWLRYSPCWS